MTSVDFTPDDLAAAGAIEPAPDPGYTYPSDPLVMASLNRWQDDKFGVIIHWGIYAAIGQGGSWSLHRERLGDFTDPPPEFTGSAAEYQTWYQDQARTFTGEEFDAAQWARACAGAGMRYAVFTTKHHDGYCLYDSAYTNYKSTAEDAGLNRDVFREFSEQFRAAGLKTGIYFSKADWSRAEYWDRARPINDRFANYPIADQPRRWDRFVQFTHDQIAELLTNYGDMNVLWLDAGWVRAPEEPIDIDGIAALARQLQPGILVVDREVHGPHENYRTPEQTYPSEVIDTPWEACVTLTKSWCSRSRDDRTKPVGEIIEMLIAIVARGGNLLLGIGPDATGHLSCYIEESLGEIGNWLDAYGQGIYGTRALGNSDAQTLSAVRARVGSEERMTYATRIADGSIALFVALQDQDAASAIELSGLPDSHEVSPLAVGDEIRREGNTLRIYPRHPYACAIRLQAH